MPLGTLSCTSSSNTTRIAPSFYFPLMMPLIGLDNVNPRIPVLVMMQTFLKLLEVFIFYRNLGRIEQRTQTIMPCC